MSYTPSIVDLTHPVVGDPAGLSFEEIRLLKAYVNTLAGGSLGYRNMLPAGNFDLNPFQRGVTFAAAATGTYVADRFMYKKVGAAVHTVARSTDVPSVALAGRQLKYSLRCTLTTPDDALGAGNFCAIATAIEAQEAASALYRRAGTLSFWIKATKIGQYPVSLWQNGASPRSCIIPFTVNVTDTWERKTLSIPATDAAATPYDGEQNGLNVQWVLASGTAFHAPVASTWLGGQYFALAANVNGVSTGSTQFLIADPILKPGSVADIQDVVYLQEVWRHCFRYYQKSMDVTDIPGSVFTTGRIAGRQYTAAATALESLYSRMMVPMRTTNPTITWYSPATGVAARVRDVTAGADLTVGSTSENGRWAAGYPNVTVAPAVGNVLQAGWIASDEMVL